MDRIIAGILIVVPIVDTLFVVVLDKALARPTMKPGVGLQTITIPTIGIRTVMDRTTAGIVTNGTRTVGILTTMAAITSKLVGKERFSCIYLLERRFCK